MAVLPDKKFTALPVVTTLAESDLVPNVASGVTSKITKADFRKSLDLAWAAYAATPQTLLITARGVEFDLATAAANCTLNLPTLASAQGMPPIPIRLVGDLTRSFTLAPNGADKINGAAASAVVGALSIPSTGRTYVLEPSPTSWVFRPLVMEPTISDAWLLSSQEQDRLWQRKVDLLVEHFHASSGTTPSGPYFNTSVTGAAAAASGIAGETGHPGILNLGTGSTTTGRVAIKMLGYQALGADAITLDFIVRVVALSTAGEEFSCVFGLGNNDTAEPTSGIFFEYLRGTSLNWLACATKVAVGQTRTDTGIAVAAATWVRLTIRINAAATSIGYYIDGVLVATVTGANIPATGVCFGPLAWILKSAGSTNRQLDVDRIARAVELTTVPA